MPNTEHKPAPLLQRAKNRNAVLAMQGPTGRDISAIPFQEDGNGRAQYIAIEQAGQLIILNRQQLNIIRHAMQA